MKIRVVWCLLSVVGLVFLLGAAGTGVEAEPKERYRIEPAMMVHLRSLEATVNSAQPTAVNEHRQVAEKLDRDLGKLISSCTMKGEAHDALHDWLVPFMGSVRTYQKKASLPDLDGSLREMKKAFESFHTQFR